MSVELKPLTADRVERDVQFVGDQYGDCGHDPLAHLGAMHRKADPAVLSDRDDNQVGSRRTGEDEGIAEIQNVGWCRQGRDDCVGDPRDRDQ